MQEPHVPPTPAQQAHVQQAVKNPALSARANGGHPAIAATPRPGAFNAAGVVGAKGAPARPPVAAYSAVHAPATGTVHPPTAPAGKLPVAKPQPPKPAKPPAEKNAEKHEEGARP